MSVHQHEQRHGNCSTPKLPEVPADLGISSIEEESPHVNNILVWRHVAQGLVLILILPSNLKKEEDNLKNCNSRS